MLEIIVRTEWVGFHRWAGAPTETSFLRNLHRHTFHVEATMSVTHADRDVEFIDLQQRVNRWIGERLMHDDTEEMSCEHWAIAIGEAFGFDTVEVNEDGENGARWRKEPQ